MKQIMNLTMDKYRALLLFIGDHIKELYDTELIHKFNSAVQSRILQSSIKAIRVPLAALRQNH